jgi:hypothetical protein
MCGIVPVENTWRNFEMMAMRDVGILIVSVDSMKFQGEKESIVIQKIRRVSFGKLGRDFINNWLKVEFGEEATPSIAFFADGGW